MAKGRMRFDDNGCYYHLMNRVGGGKAGREFGDKEKEYFMRLMKRLTVFYSVEVVSFCVMSNHYHIIVYADSALPNKAEVKRRYNAFYENSDQPVPDWNDPKVLKKFKERIRNISWFIRDLQQRFTFWYNKTREDPRRGTLWADRFKSVILEQGKAVWECIKYVEMNPLRARMVRDTADYHFSSFGEYCGKGKHPFLANFAKHLRYFWDDEGQGKSDKEVCNLLMEEFDISFQCEARKLYNIREGNDTPVNIENRELLTAHRRVRYWTEGAIIGSKLFMDSAKERFFDKQRPRKKYTNLEGKDDGIFCFRQLR